MKNYNVIFFDMDDTLFDFATSQQKAFHNVFAKHHLLHNVEQYRKSYQTISQSLWKDLENGKMSLEELGSERFKRLFLEHDITNDATLFNQDYLGFLGQQTHLTHDAEKVIRNLSHKRLAIITNGYVDVQISRMNNSPLKGVFEELIISESTGFQKPQTEIFDYAFKKLQITDKSNVLIVGDSLTSDIQGGMNFGIDTCWFNPNHQVNHTSIQPTYEINQLKKLMDIIK